MEKYTRNARFCLICNYVSKIIPALQSRCTRFRFQPLPQEFVQGRLDYICQQERYVWAAGLSLQGWQYCRADDAWLEGWEGSSAQLLLAAARGDGRPRRDSLQSASRSIKVSQSGLEALIELGGGDMRRVLNLLQSTVMSAGEVTEDSGEQQSLQWCRARGRACLKAC
jgi:DNA polymerase III delta prime subunit